MQGLKEWTNLHAHGCLLIERYTSPASCVVRIDDGRPQTLRPRTWRRAPSLLPLIPRSAELVKPGESLKQNSLFATNLLSPYVPPSLRRRCPGGGNHSGERLGKRIMCAGLALFPQTRVPRLESWIHQLFHYRYLHPSTVFPPISPGFHPWQSPRRMNIIVGSSRFMVEKDERLTPSTGTIHRPAIHSTIDPRPSHSKVRDPASTSYLTTGKFYLLKLPFHSPHVSSVGRSHEDVMSHSLPPEFHRWSRSEGWTFQNIHLNHPPANLSLYPSPSQTKFHISPWNLREEMMTNCWGQWVIHPSRSGFKPWQDHIYGWNCKNGWKTREMERTLVLEMCFFKLTWVFGSECVMQIRFVDVLCIKFSECVLQWYKIRWSIRRSELVRCAQLVSYKQCL